MDRYKVLGILISKNLEPRKFLRYCFNIDQLSTEEILEEETSFGYSTQCIHLLSKILGVNRKTVRTWGDNPNFEEMPQYARMTCKYVQLALSKEELNKILVQDFNPPQITAVEFLEEMLLKGLSPHEKLKFTTSTKFRTQSFKILSEILKVSKSALYDWGRA